MSLLQLIGLAAAMGVALSAIMAAAWYVQKRTGHTGWIDVSWTFGVGIVGALGSLAPLAANHAPSARQIVVAALIALWSLRLGGHILVRTREVGDDPRYREWIRQWGASADMRMFLQMQSQAIVALILTVSVALAAHNPSPNLDLMDGLGATILVGALAGEALSDWQLRRFRADPDNRGKICESGLWSLSRHPNYFFEWLCWLAYPLIAIDLTGANPWGWIALLAPACMYWVLVYVTGIPPLEEHMLRTRGAEFRAVQARTRPFVPLPKR